MNARDVEAAAVEIERSSDCVLRWVAAGGVIASLAGGSLAINVRLALVLFAAAAVELGAASAAWLRRRERIERLALDPAAYSIPAVANFGRRQCELPHRRQLAASIRAMVNERQALDLHLVSRTGRFAQQLESLAHELAAPAARVEPAMVVACRRLITRPVESPLYNPNLPEEDLRALLLRIRGGITGAGLTA